MHNQYAWYFTTAMAASWPQLAYLGLYSGAGRAQLRKTNEIVETTAMSVLRLPKPFTKYIFVDSDQRCIDALRQRIAVLPSKHDVSFIPGDVNVVVPDIRRAMPTFSRGRGLLSFCFVDPFAANLRFATIHGLSDYRMDFLVLLMLGRDVRTNLKQYHDDPTSTRIADFINCPDWRQDLAASRDKNIVRFMLTKFDEAMVRLGYLSAEEHLRHQITAAGTGVLQYVLVFYSKNPLGQKFWRETMKSGPPQLPLDLR